MAMRTVKLILASASPRRRDLLKNEGIKFKVVPSMVSEDYRSKKPANIVKELALKKAVSVASRLKSGIVIGADTIVVLKGEIIGKPKDKADAARILGMLSGTYHKVYSGVAVVDAMSGKKIVDYEASRVKMRRLSRKEIARFAVKHLDKAGAYAVQEKGDAFVEKIEGDYFNVVGLPVRKLKCMLSKFGMKL